MDGLFGHEINSFKQNHYTISQKVQLAGAIDITVTNSLLFTVNPKEEVK